MKLLSWHWASKSLGSGGKCLGEGRRAAGGGEPEQGAGRASKSLSSVQRQSEALELSRRPPGLALLTEVCHYREPSEF